MNHYHHRHSRFRGSSRVSGIRSRDGGWGEWKGGGEFSGVIRCRAALFGVRLLLPCLVFVRYTAVVSPHPGKCGWDCCLRYSMLAGGVRHFFSLLFGVASRGAPRTCLSLSRYLFIYLYLRVCVCVCLRAYMGSITCMCTLFNKHEHGHDQEFASICERVCMLPAFQPVLQPA